MRKRAVSLLLCLSMVLSLVPVPVSAQNVENVNPFSDVEKSDWFYDGVQYVFEHELMKGTSSTIFETLFEPERATQRGMIVTILYRLDKSPPVTDICPFEDVPRGSNYENAIIWAANNGIVTGYNDISFGPYDDITRQQMAAILYRYANFKQYDVAARADLNIFMDSSRISNYARVPLSWANAKELINGITPLTLAPTEKVTRAQSAVILTRFCENVIPGNVAPPPPEPTTYSVTFNLNYSGAGTSQVVSVTEGQTVSEPTTPKRVGYTFDGWYTASKKGTRFNFNTAINEDITLYAYWNAKPSNNSGSSNNTSSGTPATIYYTVTFDSNGGNEVASQRVKSGERATEPTNIVREGYNLTGWYTGKNAGEKYDFSTPVTADRTLYARWEIGEITDTTDSNSNNIPDSLDQIMGYETDHYDTDNDGMPDFYEEYVFGTDKERADTDGDGLPDGYELLTLGTMPTLVDTDENGIPDGEEDFDNDGLSNIREYELKTNPKNADTDYDTLSDYQEISTHGTNPLKKDTDEDGLNDNDELTYRMEPLNPITLNDGVFDGDRMFDVSLSGETSDNGNISPTLTVNLQGRQIESLTIEKIDNSDVFLNDSIPGSLGNGYDLNVDGAFSEATLSFALDSSCFSGTANPTIFYWNDGTQTLEEVPNQTRNGNVVSAQLSHFSGYTIVDKNLYTASVLEYEIKAPTDEELQNKAFDVVLVMDDSNSIDDSDFRYMQQVCLNFLEHTLTEEDRVAVITFDTLPHNITNGLTSKSEAAAKISSYTRNRQWTALYDAIYMAIDELSNQTENAKIVIVLTDGDDVTDRDRYGNKIKGSIATDSSVIEHAVNSGVVIYTVGIGENVRDDILTNIANSTHGDFNFVDSFSALDRVFERIAVDTDLYKDSDEDGISDYHEKVIAQGKLKLGNGLPLASYTSLSHLNDDSDGDGLLDGDELEILERMVNGEVVYYCRLHANPCLADTDGDEYDDYFEDYAGLDPLVNDDTQKSVPDTSDTSASLLDNAPWSGKKNNWKAFKNGIKKRFKLGWNFFHNKVEEDLRDRYDGFLEPNEYSLRVKATDELQKLYESNPQLMTLQQLNKTIMPNLGWRRAHPGKVFGRIDLIESRAVMAPHQIWDVKPISYAVDPVRKYGKNQLRRYVEVAPYSVGDDYTELIEGGFTIRGNPNGEIDPQKIELMAFTGSIIKPSNNPLDDDTHGCTIEYWNSGDGLILYAYQLPPEPLKQPQEETVRDNAVEYNSSKAYDDVAAAQDELSYSKNRGYNPDHVKEPITELLQNQQLSEKFEQFYSSLKQNLPYVVVCIVLVALIVAIGVIIAGSGGSAAPVGAPAMAGVTVLLQQVMTTMQTMNPSFAF